MQLLQNHQENHCIQLLFRKLLFPIFREVALKPQYVYGVVQRKLYHHRSTRIVVHDFLNLQDGVSIFHLEHLHHRSHAQRSEELIQQVLVVFLSVYQKEGKCHPFPTQIQQFQPQVHFLQREH